MASSQNLVPNGGFENYSTLPTNYGETYKAIGWSNVNGNYSGAPYASPDYFHLSSFMNNFFGPITPHSGQGQMGFFTYHQNLGDAREYVSTQLTSTLIVGHEYQLSFYLTNGSGGSYTAAVDNFGIHFSNSPLTQSVDEVILVTPQIEIPGVIYHSNYWQQYMFTFIANSPSNHMTFGNYEFDATTTVTGGTNSYYFIDDVELIDITFQVQGDSILCFGDTITLNAINDTILGWADSLHPGNIISTDSSITVSPNVTTTYLVYGANDTSSFTVNVYNPPTVNLGNDTILCVGETLMLDATTTNATYQWHDNSTNSTFTVAQQGTYWTEVTLNGCTASDTIIVNYNPLPTVDLGADTALCPGETLTLDATTPGATYQWHDNSTNATFTVTQQGTYWTEVTLNGCTTLDTITINYNSIPTFDLGVDTALCPGETLMLDATTPGATYQWHDNSANPTFTVTQQGTYWTEITLNSCIASDTITVNYNPLPSIDLGTDTILCQGETVTLDATNPNATYQWQDNSTSATFTVTQQGTYWTEVTLNGCITLDTITVNYNPLPPIDLGTDTAICPGETLILDATSPNATYQWHNNSTNPTFTVAQQGTYWTEITLNGCSAWDTITVNYNPLPSIDLGADTVLCQGETLMLDVTNPNATYQWHDNSTNATFVVTQQGAYWTEVSMNGCMASDTITVNYNPLPVIDLGADTAICPGETLMLDATSSNATYQWHDNSINATFAVTQQGTYWTEITLNGCMASDTITVNYNPVPIIDLGTDTVLCGEEALTLDATNPNATYQWHDNSTNATFVVTQQGAYWIEVSMNGCTGSDTIIVDYSPLPSVNLGNDTTLCPDEKLILDATVANATYLWQDNTTNPILYVDQGGNYWVEVISNNCRANSNIDITILDECHCTVYIPNSFTPNFNNLNDQFLPIFDCDITEYNFSIYNRWGQLIFNTQTLNTSWNGHFQGKMSPTGVYVYLLEYKYRGGKGYQRKYGHVSLL